METEKLTEHSNENFAFENEISSCLMQEGIVSVHRTLLIKCLRFHFRFTYFTYAAEVTKLLT